MSGLNHTEVKSDNGLVVARYDGEVWHVWYCPDFGRPDFFQYAGFLPSWPWKAAPREDSVSLWLIHFAATVGAAHDAQQVALDRRQQVRNEIAGLGRSRPLPRGIG